MLNLNVTIGAKTSSFIVEPKFNHHNVVVKREMAKSFVATAMTVMLAEMDATDIAESLKAIEIDITSRPAENAQLLSTKYLSMAKKGNADTVTLLTNTLSDIDDAMDRNISQKTMKQFVDAVAFS